MTRPRGDRDLASDDDAVRERLRQRYEPRCGAAFVLGLAVLLRRRRRLTRHARSA